MSPTCTPSAGSGHLSELASPTQELTTAPILNKISTSTSYPGGAAGFQQMQYKNQLQSGEPITNTFSSISYIDNVDSGNHKTCTSDGNISNIGHYQLSTTNGQQLTSIKPSIAASQQVNIFYTVLRM